MNFYGQKYFTWDHLHKTSKNPGKSGAGPRSQNKVGQNTFKNTSEDALDMFCDIVSQYRTDFLELQKIPDRAGPDYDEHFFYEFRNV